MCDELSSCKIERRNIVDLLLEIPIQLRAVVHVESTKSSQRQLNFVHAIFVCSTKLNAFVFNFPRRNMNLWNWTWTESRWSEPIEKKVAFSISALEPMAKKKEIPVDIEIYLSQRKPLHFFVARFATFTCGERNTKIICPDMCENQSKTMNETQTLQCLTHPHPYSRLLSIVQSQTVMTNGHINFATMTFISKRSEQKPYGYWLQQSIAFI